MPAQAGATAAPATSRPARPSRTAWSGRASMPLPGEDPRLAVQGQEIAVLGHQHVREQGLGRHPAGDRPLRRGRLHHRLLAGPAAVAGAADHPHPQHGGDDVEHLARVLADDVHGPAAARAALVLDVDQDLDPRQVRRQGAQVAPPRPGRPRGIAAPCRRLSCAASAAAAACSRSSRPSWSWSGSSFSERRPNRPRCSCRISSRSFSISACAASRSDQDSIALGLQTHAHRVQRSAGRRLPPSAATAAAADQDLAEDHPAPATWRYSIGRQAEKASTSAHQAVLGRRTGRGWSRCHGKPSSSVASCAPVSRTTPSAGEGQQNRPASSLFAYRTRPVPS